MFARKLPEIIPLRRLSPPPLPEDEALKPHTSRPKKRRAHSIRKRSRVRPPNTHKKQSWFISTHKQKNQPRLNYNSYHKSFLPAFFLRLEKKILFHKKIQKKRTLSKVLLFLLIVQRIVTYNLGRRTTSARYFHCLSASFRFLC